MHIARKLYLGLGTPLMSLFIFLAVILGSVGMALGQPTQLKRWLREAKLYDNVVPAIIGQSKKEQPAKQPGEGAGEMTFDRPEVQTALKQAVTPAWLEQSAENVIDGTYAWLQQKTDKPTYNIDVSGIKTAFAGSITQQARARLASLPPCSLRNQPASTDPFVINCQPPAGTIETELQKLTAEITTSKNFLPHNITADTTSLGPEDAPIDPNVMTPLPEPIEKQSKPWYQQAQQLPTIYRWLMIGPVILGVLALLLGAGIMFAASNWRHGLHIVASTMLSAGILVAIGAAFTAFVASRLRGSIGQQHDLADLQRPFVDILMLASSSISRTQLIISGILIVLSATGLIALRLTRPPVPPEGVAQPPIDQARASLPPPTA